MVPLLKALDRLSTEETKQKVLLIFFDPPQLAVLRFYHQSTLFKKGYKNELILLLQWMLSILAGSSSLKADLFLGRLGLVLFLVVLLWFLVTKSSHGKSPITVIPKNGKKVNVKYSQKSI